MLIPRPQIHFGAPWPPLIASVIRNKVADPRIQRKIGLEGHRFTAQEAFQAGFVDVVASGDTEDIIKKAQELGEVVGANATLGAWGLIRVSWLSPEKEYRQTMLMSCFHLQERAVRGHREGVAQRRPPSEVCCFG